MGCIQSITKTTTKNPTLKNFHFRELIQNEGESFSAFCNKVVKEATHCYFNCENVNCNAHEISISEQMVIGTRSSKIREALMKSWNLQDLRREGMKIESASRGGAEITGEQVNKTGKYSYRSMRKDKEANSKVKPKLTCFNCGYLIHKGSISIHKENCPARKQACKNCSKMGHFASVSRQYKPVKLVDLDKEEENKADDKHDDNSEEDPVYNINLFHVKTLQPRVKPKLLSSIHSSCKNDFTVQVEVNNSLRH